MHMRRELRTGLRLGVMALVFLAISCDSGGSDDGCGADGLITGCSGGCGTGLEMAPGEGCLGDCIAGGGGGAGGLLGDGCDMGDMLGGCGDDDGGCMGDCSADSLLGDCGDGCGSDEPYTYGQGPMIEGGVQVHVTNSLFQFLTGSLIDLVTTFLVSDDDDGSDLPVDIAPDGTVTICIDSDSVCGPSKVASCGSTGKPGCKIEAKLGDVKIEPRGKSGQGAGAEVYVKIPIDNLQGKLDLDMDLLGQQLDCTINVSRKANKDFYIAVTAHLPINSVDKNTEIYVGGSDLKVVLDGLEIQVTDKNSTPGSFCEIAGALAGSQEIQEMLVEEIQKAFGAFTCRGCASDDDCGAGGYCDFEYGYCVDNTGRACQGIQLGAELGVDLTGILKGFDPAAEGAFGVKAYMGSYVQTQNQGLQLGMRLGAKSVDRSSLCAPMRLSPITKERGCRNGKSCEPLELLNATNKTPSGEDFQVGIGVSIAALNQIMWAAYSSGALCLSVGGDSAAIPELSMLNTNTISLFIESLEELTYGVEQPLLLQLRPQFPPTIDLKDAGAEGTEIIVNIPGLGIDFYTGIDDRYQRLFSLVLDLSLPLGLKYENDMIDISLGDLKDVFKGDAMQVAYVEMVDWNEVQKLASGLGELIGGFAGTLLGDGLIDPIDLGDMLKDLPAGLSAGLVGSGFEVIEENGQPAALGIFAKVGLDGGTNGLKRKLEPHVVSVDVTTPIGSEIRSKARRSAGANGTGEFSFADLIPTIKATMAVTGVDLSDDDIEYAYSINHSAWSFWKKGPELVIESPVAMAENKYTVRVTARRVGDGSSGSVAPATFEFVNDYTAPRAQLSAQDGLVVVDATDNVYAKDELVMQYRLNGGYWSERAPLHAIDITQEIRQHGRVTVDTYVEDPSGNARSIRQRFQEKTANKDEGSETTTTTTDGNDDGGCSSTGTQGGWMALLAMLGLVFTRRRRRQRTATSSLPHAPLMLFVLLSMGVTLSACGKKDDPGGEGELCMPECEVDFICINGACEENVCESTDDCPGATECIEDTCVNTSKGCRYNDDCEHGNFCHEKTGVCYPSQCSTYEECPADKCGDTLMRFCDYDDYALVEAGQCLCRDRQDLGNFGSWLKTVQLEDGSIVALAYHDDYGDLMVGTMDTRDDTFDWDFVDGVPDKFPVNAPEGPRGGIIQPGDDAGRYLSVAHEVVDGSDVLHVAYQYVVEKSSESSLRYARGVKGEAGWAWNFIDVDSENHAGLFPSIVLMPSATDEEGTGGVGIVYMTADIINAAVEENPEEGIHAAAAEYLSTFSSAYAPTRTPGSAEDFTINDGLDFRNSPSPCAALCDSKSVCVASTNECKSFSLDCAGGVDDDKKKGLCKNGTGVCVKQGDDAVCVQGTLPAPAPSILPKGLGLFSSAQVDKNGVVHVSYYDQFAGVLKYVRAKVQDGKLARVNAPLIIEGQDDAQSLGDVGRWSFLQVAPDGRVVIFYEDTGLAQLHAAVINPSSDEVNIFVLDDGIYADANGLKVQNNRIGASIVARPLTSGGFEVFYQDNTNNLVRRILWKNIDLQPKGHPFAVFGSRRALARDLIGDEQPISKAQQAVPKIYGSFGFFTQVMDRPDRTIFISKYIGYETEEAAANGQGGVRMGVATGSVKGRLDGAGGTEPDPGGGTGPIPQNP